MFTVIILSNRAKAIFEQSRVLFEPFREEGTIAFCDWHPSPNATSIAQVLPQLSAVIEGRREWRAVVVDDVADAIDPARSDRENPFDYGSVIGEDDGTVGLGLRPSKQPLVQLAHYLLGYPELGIKSFAPVVSYVDPKTGDRKVTEAGPDESHGNGDGGALSAYRAALVTGNDVQVHYQEVPYSPIEQRTWEVLSRQYNMRQQRPSTVIFVSTRPPVETDPTAALRKAWHVGDQQHASRFVERNAYPPSSRFAVYDLINSERAGYDLEVMRFWLSVLSLTINTLPPSAFQAERIYRMSVSIDEAVLGQTLNDHMGRLAGIRDDLEAFMTRPTQHDQTELAKILEAQRIQLDFTTLGGDDLSVPTSGYALAADVGRSDLTRWQERVSDLTVKTDTFVRKPRRVLAKAVNLARQKSRSFTGDHDLQPMDREELATELARRLPRLAAPATVDILDRAKLARIVAEHDSKVTQSILTRMRLSTIAVASAVVLGAWLATFLPYLIQSFSAGFVGAAESDVVVLAVLGLVALVAALTLLAQRLRLLRHMQSMNRELRRFASNVKAGATTIALYLAELSTYMYGRSVLIGAARRDQQAHRRIFRRRALLSRISRAMETEKAVVRSLSVPIAIRLDRGGVGNFDVDDDRAVESIFRLPVGERMVEINATGEMTNAPYDFVTHLHIERLGLYERTISVHADAATMEI